MAIAMKKIFIFTIILLLAGLVLIGGSCGGGENGENGEVEKETKTDTEIIRGFMEEVAKELGWPTDTQFIKGFADGPKILFNDTGDWQGCELHITAEPSESEECKIFMSGVFQEFYTFKEIEISGFTVCENITYRSCDKGDECSSTYDGYANWMRTYVGGYEFRATGSRAHTEEYSVRSLMALLIKHINKHYKDGEWQ